MQYASEGLFHVILLRSITDLILCTGMTVTIPGERYQEPTRLLPAMGWRA